MPFMQRVGIQQKTAVLRLLGSWHTETVTRSGVRSARPARQMRRHPPVHRFLHGKLVMPLADVLQEGVPAICLAEEVCAIAPGQFNKITVWALTNTQTLTTSSPNLQLSLKDVTSEVYGTPVPERQRPGPRPLGSSVGEPLRGGGQRQPHEPGGVRRWAAVEPAEHHGARAS
jgi:hypothetical protein